jgi:nicotinamidase-related amidase
MTKALIALHFQNDICHPEGLIPFAIDRSAATPDLFLDRSRTLISSARQAGWLVAHVHIAFQPDYSDQPRNAKKIVPGGGRDRCAEAGHLGCGAHARLRAGPR